MFLVIVGLSCFQDAFAVDAANCIVPNEHESVTFLLIDRTDELKNVDNLDKSLEALKALLQPGERLVAAVSTDRASETRILLDIVRPKGSLWVSKLKIRAQEKHFEDCFGQLRSEMLVQDEEHPSSALLETLSFASKALSSDHSPKKRLVIFSDMMQNSKELSFYGVKNFVANDFVQRAEKLSLVWDLRDVQVAVAGVGSGVSDSTGRAIEGFWKQYFEKTGASLNYYGPVLLATL